MNAINLDSVQERISAILAEIELGAARAEATAPCPPAKLADVEPKPMRTDLPRILGYRQSRGFHELAAVGARVGDPRGIPRGSTLYDIAWANRRAPVSRSTLFTPSREEANPVGYRASARVYRARPLGPRTGTGTRIYVPSK